MHDISFRPLTVDDVAEMSHIERLSFSRPTSKEAYTNELANNERAYYFGLFDGEQLIAFGGYWLILDEGHIINMGSTAGIYAYAGAAVYSATKAAVKTFSDGLRIDTIATDIKVTTIQPGIVETDFSQVRFHPASVLQPH